MSVTFPIDLEHQDDGRWIAEIRESPGALCCGQSRDEALARVQALALRGLAERVEHAEAPAELLDVSFPASWAHGLQHERAACSPRSSGSVGQAPGWLPPYSPGTQLARIRVRLP